jgi:hypothetical protein
MSEPILPAMTDLGERLAADEDLSERDRVFALLRERRSTAKKSLDAGLPPEESRRVSGEVAALDAAERIIASVSFFHQRKV